MARRKRPRRSPLARAPFDRRKPSSSRRRSPSLSRPPINATSCIAISSPRTCSSSTAMSRERSSSTSAWRDKGGRYDPHGRWGGHRNAGVHVRRSEIRGERVDARADVYGFGVVLFAALVGRPPIAGPHRVAVLAKALAEPPPRPSELRPEVPHRASTSLVLSLLGAKEKDARPRDGGEVAALLAGLTHAPTIERRAPMAVTAREQRIACVVLCGRCRRTLRPSRCATEPFARHGPRLFHDADVFECRRSRRRPRGNAPPTHARDVARHHPRVVEPR